MDMDIQTFDIPRLVSIYPDKDGIRWWTKLWINNRHKGERAIEIDRQLAIAFIRDTIGKDEWCEKYFPRQMEVYHTAISQAKQQYISMLHQL